MISKVAENCYRTDTKLRILTNLQLLQNVAANNYTQVIIINFDVFFYCVNTISIIGNTS